ncbi:thiol protease/hemagglutinin PrtT [Porphyromonas sp. COT-290 OH860]|uniref:thiol protease/hemagglutinin PrtT n=1 Tax=Porphyromonas sp. COT-290 OH860 TaxID=1515615 RepID=UPI00052C374F|nr:thiol protease/hemagglutinin PrtT [Porphyromonas sp. COT-290 OH860]KGN83679.1 hypothetical protein HQ41_06415 [Porphyromonas sp. COT-290 OH860]
MKQRSILSYLAFGLCLLLAWSGWAGPIGREQAMRLAERYVQIDRAGELRLAEGEKKGGLKPTYYIFNDTDRSGFVIISGDDTTIPVLGYSDKGQVHLNRLPEQLSGLLKRHQKQVDALRSTAVTPGLPSPTPKPNPKAIRGPLTKSLWDQDKPFNDQAPIIGKERTVTGCVATAISQVMYYHKWPERGKGKHTYTPRTGSIGELSADFEQSVYDWANMIDSYTFDWKWNNDTRTYDKEGHWTEAQGKAVAKLMSDVGIAVNMNYRRSRDGGSGAYMHDAARALKKHFSYHVRHLSRNESPNQLFLSLIQQELDLDNPIIMSGAQNDAGHAWVIDGYDENGYLHTNWGWGGTSNGYFALSFMSPPILGHGGGDGGFNQGQDIILVRPDREGHEPFPIQERRYSFFGDGGLSFRSEITDLDQDKIGLMLTNLSTNASDLYRGDLSISLRDASGQEIMLSQTNLDLTGISRGSYFTSLLTSITLDPMPADGTYTLRAVCREIIEPDTNVDVPNAQPWLEVEYGEPLSIEINQGRITLPTIPTEINLSLSKEPKQTTLFWSNHQTSLQLSISNSTRFTTDYGYIVVELSRAGVSVDKMRSEGYQFFDHSTFDGIITFHQTPSSSLAAGIYDVTFSFLVPSKTVHYTDGTSQTIPERSYPINNPFGTYKLEILDANQKPILTYRPNRNSNLDTPESGTKDLEIRLNDELWTEEELDLKQLDSSTLSIACEIENVGAESFTGSLRYDLVDVELGQRYPLGATGELTIHKHRSVDISKTKINIPKSAFEPIPLGRTYELHLTANIAGVDRDVWATGTYRRTLKLKQGGTPTPPKTYYKVTLTSNEGGRISIPDVQLSAVEAKKELRVIVEPEIGYELASLTAGGKDIKDTKTFVVEGDTEVIAQFTKKVYRVTQKVEGQGSIKISGADKLEAVTHGTQLSIQASPAEGYELASLTAGGTDIKATKTFIVERDTEVIAQFTKKVYRVTQKVEGQGSIKISGADKLEAVPHGARLSVQASPAEGYELASLTAGGTDIKDTKTFVVEGDTEVIAQFAKKVYRVTQKVEGQGSIKISGADKLEAVPHGMQLSVQASPAEGYELASLTAGGTEIKATRTFVVERDTEVIAQFAKKVYRVDVPNALEHATLRVEGAQDLSAVEYGTELTLIITPQASYLIDEVKVNNRPLDAPYRFSVTEQCTVEITIKQDTGLTDIAGAEALIYPNPASHFVIIKHVSPSTPLRLRTLDGRVVRQAAMPEANEFRWSVADLGRGLYIIEIGLQAYKLILE